MARHPLVCLPTGTGIRTVLDRACDGAGLTPTVALQASAPDAVADLARRGLGAAILSDSMTALREPGLVAARLSGVGLPAVLALVWLRRTDPALGELVRSRRARFGEQLVAAGEGARETSGVPIPESEGGSRGQVLRAGAALFEGGGRGPGEGGHRGGGEQGPPAGLGVGPPFIPHE